MDNQEFDEKLRNEVLSNIDDCDNCLLNHVCADEFDLHICTAKILKQQLQTTTAKLDKAEKDIEDFKCLLNQSTEQLEKTVEKLDKAESKLKDIEREIVSKIEYSILYNDVEARDRLRELKQLIKEGAK
jgi:septal ring factor EnvC (AmiA/AmiB activator)